MNHKNQGDTKVTRRSFLGFASFGAVILSGLTALGGIMRYSKPNVHYEESKQFKIGNPDNFPVGLVKKLEDKRVYVFSNPEGLHAISSICTHLGCLVAITETGFQCPCHGSKFNRQGKVIAGPAPRPLPWLEISQNIDGTLVIDAAKEVKRGTTFKV